MEKYLESPRPRVKTPNKLQDIAMVWIWFSRPFHMEIKIPPKIEPRKKTTSLAVRRQTSSPKERATISGVRNATGTNKKKKTA